MRILLNNTETYRVDTEEEAKALIEEMKENASDYIVDSYSSVRKEKKKKGEIIAEGYQVKITKKYSDFWVMEEAE
ncbi:MAG: hypothetical protein J6I85_05445 [Clostridia bacterium]|jgi:outer membrane lipopolysaccharide assembly protein LptE/RlpB|nr:hypothetical protein [Clostridia bacterium]